MDRVGKVILEINAIISKEKIITIKEEFRDQGYQFERTRYKD